MEEERPDQEKIRVLEGVHKYIWDEYGLSINTFNHFSSMGYITYELLEHLIPPNTLIYTYHALTEQDQALLARRIEYVDFLGRCYVRVVCDMVTDDGKGFGLAHTEIKIDQFAGIRSIQELVAYPFAYHKDSRELYGTMYNRGARYAAMTKYKHAEISGLAMRETSSVLASAEKFYVRLFLGPRLDLNTHFRVGCGEGGY